MSKLDEIFENYDEFSEGYPTTTKQQIKDLMLELVASFEVKSLPSDDPELRYWQGYADAQLHISQKVEEL